MEGLALMFFGSRRGAKDAENMSYSPRLGVQKT
jgi:hypothetical protein